MMKRMRIGAVLAAAAISLGAFSGAAFAGNGNGNGGTDHFGPFASTSPDNGSCGQQWAVDTADRFFTVHNNGDGTFRVDEQFKDGSFTTTGPVSPGACETTPHHGSTVQPGIVGHFTGFLRGTVTSSTYNPAGCAAATADCSTTQGFLKAVFGPQGTATFTCNLGYAGCDFNFEYSSSDQSLQYHHWQDKSDNHGGEKFEGDIANA